MTSFAFILGVLPLALARGAGAGGQNAIGIGVIGGMLAATFVGIFFTPWFFILVTKLFTGAKKTAQRAGRAGALRRRGDGAGAWRDRAVTLSPRGRSRRRNVGPPRWRSGAGARHSADLSPRARRVRPDGHVRGRR